MKKKYIISIDQGTTSTKSILYDSKINPIDSANIEIKQYYPHEGWVEHDPEEIWKSILITINSLLAQFANFSSNIDLRQIKENDRFVLCTNTKWMENYHNARGMFYSL